MIEFVGRLIAREKGPFIYVIRKGPYLYIGETQRNPILRWGEHLRIEGSFQKALQSRDEEFLLKDVEMEFFAYRCTRIENEVLAVEKRKITQIVEHELHVKFVCRGKNTFELISDTTKTAPTGSRYKWINEIVDEIYDEFHTKAMCRTFF